MHMQNPHVDVPKLIWLKEEGVDSDLCILTSTPAWRWTPGHLENLQGFSRSLKASWSNLLVHVLLEETEPLISGPVEVYSEGRHFARLCPCFLRLCILELSGTLCWKSKSSNSLHPVMSGSDSHSFVMDIRLVSSAFTLIDREDLSFSKLTLSPGWWIRQTW